MKNIVIVGGNLKNLKHTKKIYIKFINNYELVILLKEKFKSERGRINCSLWHAAERWRWLGIQYVIQDY